MPRRDRLEHRAHPHRVGTEALCHPSLRRRLIRGPEVPRVDTTHQLEAPSLRGLDRHRAQRRIVRVAHVGETRPERVLVRPRQRALPGEVQVIVDEHQIAWRERCIRAARRVRDDHDARTHRDHQSRAEHDVGRRVTLIEVHATLHRDDVDALRATDDEVARVSDHVAHRHRRDVAVRDLRRGLERVGESAEPRSEHERDTRRDLRARADERERSRDPLAL